MIWAILRWAAESGAKTLDVGGIDRAEALDSTGTSAPHKMRLGGTPILFPAPLELIPNPALRAAFGALQSSRWLRRVQGRWRGDSPSKAD